MSELTRQQLDYWVDYIRELTDRLDLCDWVLKLKGTLLDKEPDNHDVIPLAQIRFIDGSKRADIELHEEFLRRDPEVQRHILCHELVHCHFGAAWRQVENDLEELLGKPADRVFWSSFSRNMETGIDAVAIAFARTCPLPASPEEISPPKKVTARRKSTGRKGART